MNKKTRNKNKMTAIVLSTGFGILAAMSIMAQEENVKIEAASRTMEPARTSGLVSIELRMIEMPRLAADEVFKEQGGIAKAYVINEKTLGTISDMVIGNKAKVVGQLQTVTKSGQNAEIKSVREIVYPTEYDIDLCAARVGVVKTTNTFEMKEMETPTAALIPGGFEKREIGTILSVSPVIAPSGTMIDLTLIPQRIRKSEHPHKPEISWPGGRTPLFMTETMATSITAPSGKALLMGVCDAIMDEEKPGKTGENIILWIVTTTIVSLN